MRNAIGIAVAFCAMIAACSSARVDFPTGSALFPPPPVYSEWWEMVEACSQRVGPLEQVKWFQAPDEAAIVVNGAAVDAYWDKTSNAIVVKPAVKLDGSLVRHEMLHALSRSTAHSRPDFLEHCGGVVACAPTCVSAVETFQLPGSAVPRVSPESLTITSIVEPVGALGEVKDTFFRLTVFARNPTNHPIVVVLPPSGDAGPSLSFSYVISGSSTFEYNDRAWDSEIMSFGAQETKRRVFDFVVRPTMDMNFAITPGTYQVRGAFGERSAAPVSMTIRP